MAKPDWMGCTGPRELHSRLHVRAARMARSINPANSPINGVLAMAAATRPDIVRIAVQTSKFWGPGGVHLTVSFMEKTAASLQDKILAEMNAWSRYCNASFSRVDGKGEVRISRGRGGYWSYLGTDIKMIPSNQQTMNLEGFVTATPQSEYVRVIRHETGHTLGCVHEHLRSSLVKRLDEQKTIAYFGRTQGWSPDEVRAQVLTPIPESLLTGTPGADEVSIMCYDIPGECTIDGQPITGGSDLDATDRDFMAKLYPLTVTPPPAPPPGGKWRITLDVDKATGVVSVVP